MRELAQELQLSAAAVHKRLLQLEESGLVQGYACLLHPGVLGGRVIGTFGTCDRALDRAACDRIGAHPHIFQVVALSGNQASMTFVLPPRATADAALAHAAAVARFQPAFVATIRVPWPDPEPRELTDLECAVLCALRHDARRPTSSIANALGIDDRLVRENIRSLVAGRMVSFQLDIQPLRSTGSFALLHVDTEPGRAVEVAMELMSRLQPQIQGLHGFVERADLLVAFCWIGRTEDIGALQEAVLRLSGVAGCTPMLFYAGAIYPIWIDELLATRAAGYLPVG